MKHRFLSLSSVFFTLFSAALLAASADEVEVLDPYVRAVPPVLENSAAFLTLKNSDDQAHALVSAKSDAAKFVELHTHLNDNGVKRMRQVDRIQVQPKAETKLQPGGFHIMLIGLQQQLEIGQKIDLELLFDDGSRKTVSAEVRKIKGGMHHHH